MEQNVQKADLDKNSDLRVVDENGARVWVTYVGEAACGTERNDKTDILPSFSG